MGKKRIAAKGASAEDAFKQRTRSKLPKKKVDSVRYYVHATFNNTKGLLTDPKGNALVASSAGSLGFKGAKKGTPFAAAKVGELLGETAQVMGVKTARIIVKGAGAGRDSALRAFSSKGINIISISDETPIPHNGPRKPKSRRV